MLKVSNLQQHCNFGIEGCIKWGCIVLPVNIGVDNDVVFTVKSILRVLIYIYIHNTIYTAEKLSYLELS